MPCVLTHAAGHAHGRGGGVHAPDGTAAVRFVSHAPLLGDVGETWFRTDGHLFQLSVSAPDHELQDAWIRDLAATLTFPPAGAAAASLQQQ